MNETDKDRLINLLMRVAENVSNGDRMWHGFSNNEWSEYQKLQEQWEASQTVKPAVLSEG